MKRIFLSFLFFFVGSFLVQTKAIPYSSDPESFISEVIDEAKVILSSSSSSDEKAKKLSEIAIKTVDVKGLAYYTLGKKRKELTTPIFFSRRGVSRNFDRAKTSSHGWVFLRKKFFILERTISIKKLISWITRT